MEERIIPMERNAAPTSLFDFGTNLDRAWKFAATLSESQIIPDTFRKNPASCLIALDMANRMRRNPLEIMQAMYIVHGKPSFSSSFLISLINSCGYYDPLRFEFKGDGDKRSCTAWTTDKRTGEKIEGPEITIQMAKDEGWFNKSGSKWKTMPEVMLRYRAASFFSRAYCPDLTGGFHSVEEVSDSQEPVTLKPQENSLGANYENADLKTKLLGSKAKKEPEPTPESTAPIPTRNVPNFEAGIGTVEVVPAETTLPMDNGLPLDNGHSDSTSIKPFHDGVERLRAELDQGFEIAGYTADEANNWVMTHFGKEKKKLPRDELRGAIIKLNSEMDARQGV